MSAENEEFKVSFGDLERGTLFPVKSIEVRQFTYKGNNGEDVTKRSLKALLLDEELEIFSYLPKKLVDDIDDELCKKINEAGAKIDPADMYKVCFYGSNTTGSMVSFVGRLHLPTETRSELLFKKMTLLMSKYGKRKAEDSGEGPSAKKSN